MRSAARTYGPCVLETANDLSDLARLLEGSAARSGEHLRSAFAQGDRWLDAAGLVKELKGILEVHLAVVSGSGGPLVAPVDAIFFRGKLWIGLPGASLRAKLIRRDPRVSVSFTRGDLGFIIHGSFNGVSNDEAHEAGYTALVRDLYTEAYGDWFGAWLDNKEARDDVTGFVDPRVMFAKK